MTALLIVALAFLVVVPGAIVADLLNDVPRVAQWIARFAERLLRPHDRAFFGWAAEIEYAVTEAAQGKRSRLSVLAMSSKMVALAVLQRARARKVRYAIYWERSPDSVKIYFTVIDPDPNGFQSESGWATWVGEDDDGDLYKLDTHLWFTDVAFRGDVIRADLVPLEDTPEYGYLEFAKVVAASGDPQVHLWNNWRIAPRRRLHRLHRRLRDLGMSAEWASPNLGCGALPSGPDLEVALVVLRRRRVYWESVERATPPISEAA